MQSLSRIAGWMASKGVARARSVVGWARGEWPFLLCAAIALVTIWGHRFPAGVDIPQHANYFRIATDLTVGPSELRTLYRVDPFTPYLCAYLVAYPFALLFGAIAATKCLLTMAALGTPLAMRRWLKTLGAPSELSLLGFLLAFDLPYYWGFISHELAMPLAFLYLTAFERQGDRPGGRAILKTFLAAAALFFCHGITFGLVTLIVAIRLLLRRHPFEAWRAGLHALPVGFLAILWSQLNRRNTGQRFGDDWLDANRLWRLFSSPFTTIENHTWAVVSGVGIVLIVLAAWPRIVWQGRRIVPFAVAMSLFLSLPDTVADTWLVGSRFCVYVHAFAPALLQTRNSTWRARVWPRVVLVWVVFALGALNVRLVSFNRELADLQELTKHMQPGFDMRTMLPNTAPDSEAMGFMQFHHAAGWLTAQMGGILDNDSPDYYQMPIRRQPTTWPEFHRYILARGDVAEVTRKVTEQSRTARLVHRASSWLLFENPPVGNSDFTVVRSMQSWGQLQRDKEVAEAPLTVGGARFAHGLGTHADSFIRLRIHKHGQTFFGGCGIDDRGGPSGVARFRIRDDAGKILYESGEIRGGEPARRFIVRLDGRKELILEVHKVDTIDHAHADWVDLHVTSSQSANVTSVLDEASQLPRDRA
jgi:hypothetical protein